MREILFRGKDKNGIWRYGGAVYQKKQKYLKEQYYIFESNFSGLEAFEIPNPKTLGQYTGLNDSTQWHELTSEEKDKWIDSGKTAEEWDGKKIFEGDIYYEPDRKCNVVIIFQDGCFLARDAHGKNGFVSPSNEFKKLGNIHDNQELWK